MRIERVKLFKILFILKIKNLNKNCRFNFCFYNLKRLIIFRFIFVLQTETLFRYIGCKSFSIIDCSFLNRYDKANVP